MKNPEKLNFPNKKDQFEDVAFVKDMNAYQLRVFIKRMWANLGTLANQMEGRRSDVSTVIDKIRNGLRWTKKDLDDRNVYVSYEGYVIKFDTLTKEMNVLNTNYEHIDGPFKGVTISDIKRIRAERKVKA